MKWIDCLLSFFVSLPACKGHFALAFTPLPACKGCFALAFTPLPACKELFSLPAFCSVFIKNVYSVLLSHCKRNLDASDFSGHLSVGRFDLSVGRFLRTVDILGLFKNPCFWAKKSPLAEGGDKWKRERRFIALFQNTQYNGSGQAPMFAVLANLLWFGLLPAGSFRSADNHSRLIANQK